LIPTSAGSILSVSATIMAGKIPVMINYSTGAENNCNYAKKKCGFDTIIASKALLEKIKCPVLPGMILIEDVMASVSILEKISAALMAKKPAETIIRKLPAADLDDSVVILFTGGSEKEPKAVQLTHKNIGANLEAIIKTFKLTHDDVLFSMLPLFHVFGYTVDNWLPLVTGMTNITYANPLEYKKIPELVRMEKPTMIAGTPIFFGGYLRESKKGDFASLRITIAGADKIPDWLRKGFMEQHGVQLLEGYGTTETSPVISVNTNEENRPGSIGKPLYNLTVKIVDPETGKEVASGQEGKLLVKGDSVMKGYLSRELTAAAIKDGWYDTGDIAMVDDDGYIWHKGRYKRFVKIGGEMVSLVATELIMEELLPDGTSLCIVDVPDKVKGAKLVAALTAKIDEEDIIRRMSEKLPSIAIPNKFVILEELPKMGSGKVDFRTVAKMVQEALK
jgi:acyl-[acyl-carrier-protein]-phospholipid O-acyltransferase/long-chain-fatty-acid--[acyl-carrier-protein] ligase